MSDFEVPTPILCSPYDEPTAHWWLLPDKPAEKRPGRRPSTYWWKSKAQEQAAGDGNDPRVAPGTLIELKLINLIRQRVAAWRKEAIAGGGGVTRTTCELLNWWRRDGRQQRLFFAQLEAAETIIFLNEARSDLRQGIDVPLDEPTANQLAEGYRAFRRYACKMATGSGKTTVMAMLAAWSILNKIADRGDARFSDTVLAVCPNVTIRNRLEELKPELDDASLYRKRDLVPVHLLPQLRQGRVLVTNWHNLEPQAVKVGDTPARVSRAGRKVERLETIVVGERVTTARGNRYMTPVAIAVAARSGDLEIREEIKDRDGRLIKVKAVAHDYVESDQALVQRVLGREAGKKQNVLVFNDEAHHAYRVQPPAADDGEDVDEDDDELDDFRREATVWVEGLDRIHKVCGIRQCIDLSATPYFLKAAGNQTNRIFSWVVSDFSLTDAIESGLVKVPQLAVRDPSGAAIPAYFNIWKWILPRLTPQERGGRRGVPKPEAILKWAHTPIVMLGSLWQEEAKLWAADAEKQGRTPALILVCKNTKIAKVVYEWIADDRPPYGIPRAQMPYFRNADGVEWTIRADTKVVQETDSGHAMSDRDAWMRITLDTVGKREWPRDRQGRELFPEDFEVLAKKLDKPLHPPGRDVRCIVSVGMLTEGWDCNTVTHIIGLRPFMSQLLCEQVVGRGLRRASYEVGADGLLTEEVARVLGVPFEVLPCKENPKGPEKNPQPRHHVVALPERAALAIRFPRVEGYRQAIKNRVTIEWDAIATLLLDASRVPPEVQMKATLPANSGRPTLHGPGRLDTADLQAWRAGKRIQQLSFEMARELVRMYRENPDCTVPVHVLFPQVQRLVDRYLRERVLPSQGTALVDAFLAPYYGYVLERLIEAIKPDSRGGETPELPVYEQNREPGSTAEVDFWTSKDARPVVKSHLNAVVADTKKWEQQAAYVLDTSQHVLAFAKNDHLGFAIPYLHDGQPHDYVPDFLVRLAGKDAPTLILETKGYDPLRQIKQQAAQRWVAAVTADGRHGRWAYAMATAIEQIPELLARSIGGA
ncbi:MAG: type III restriction endonuclease subunit R [Planctomycetota bacterium]